MKIGLTLNTDKATLFVQKGIYFEFRTLCRERELSIDRKVRFHTRNIISGLPSPSHTAAQHLFPSALDASLCQTTKNSSLLGPKILNRSRCLVCAVLCVAGLLVMCCAVQAVLTSNRLPKMSVCHSTLRPLII